nr:hypothetical protein [Tanacetum cinerariifolium]
MNRLGLGVCAGEGGGVLVGVVGCGRVAGKEGRMELQVRQENWVVVNSRSLNVGGKKGRWKDSNTPGKKVPKKVLRYVLIIPRLQRLYKSSHTAREMTWPATRKCMEPSKMQHLVDGRIWKNFETKHRQGKTRLGKVGHLKWLVAWPNQKREVLEALGCVFFLTSEQKKFCQFIKGVKLPDGFGSNFKHKVTNNDSDKTGLKSHDCHIMMQCLLPYGLQQYLPDEVAKPIIELCSFFKQICSVTLMEDDMLKARKALEGGPIRPRWMFPFERFMKKLKGYVRNKAKTEGSIAEGYVAEEALTFCSYYFQDVTMKFNRPDPNVDPPPPTYNDPGVSATSELFAFDLRTNTDSNLSQLLCSQRCEGCHYGRGRSDVIHFDNSPDLPLSTSFNDLDNTTLHIDGQSMEVDAAPDIINLDKDDNIIDDEDALPHDLADKCAYLYYFVHEFL